MSKHKYNKYGQHKNYNNANNDSRSGNNNDKRRETPDKYNSSNPVQFQKYAADY
jgi:hypothetical protein